MMSKSKQKWYIHNTHTGWEKSLPTSTRRRKALQGHKNDRLAAARGLQALANVTQDAVTRRLASLDARYFYRLYRREQEEHRTLKSTGL